MAKRMTARYSGTCAAGCGVKVRPGDVIVYDAPTRRLRHQGCGPVDRPAVAAEPVGLNDRDAQYVRWLGKALMENRGKDAAGTVANTWRHVAECSEFWDGEEEFEAAARREFDRLLPYAVAQNAAVHPGWTL